MGKIPFRKKHGTPGKRSLQGSVRKILGGGVSSITSPEKAKEGLGHRASESDHQKRNEHLLKDSPEGVYPKKKKRN